MKHKNNFTDTKKKLLRFFAKVNDKVFQFK